MPQIRSFEANVRRQRAAARRVLELCDRRGGGGFELVRGDNSEPVPAALVKVLREFARAASEADGAIVVTIAPADEPMTSQQAADILNVSRPFVAKLADRGELPMIKVGTHRRFLSRDVAELATRMQLQRDQALAAIAPEVGYTDGDF